MSVSLERVSNDPPTFVCRMHPAGGTWETEATYNGSATITIHGAVAVIRGLHAVRLSPEERVDILAAVGEKGAVALIGTHHGRFWVGLTGS